MAWLQGVRLIDVTGLPALPEEARRPCTTAGIWHFMYNTELRIADVWFLRELSAAEYYRKARSRPLAGWHLATTWQPSTVMQQWTWTYTATSCPDAGSSSQASLLELTRLDDRAIPK